MIKNKNSSKRKAFVFAYHNVGVRCLKVLLAFDIEVVMVITHKDRLDETIWFDSVENTAAAYNLPCIITENSIDQNIQNQLFNCNAKSGPIDFIFSFYYRNMIPASILKLAKIGAFNMHGSLLPKYRGRAPINWAILHGESQTGATLHEMEIKPDAGAIIWQIKVPILPDDVACEVFNKVVVAAEQALFAALPSLIYDKIKRLENCLSDGSYFGGRRPSDGLIDWTQPASKVYNLYRALAPPYPGAFTKISGRDCIIVKAKLTTNTPPQLNNNNVGLYIINNILYGLCGDGKAIIVELVNYNHAIISPSSGQLQLD